MEYRSNATIVCVLSCEMIQFKEAREEKGLFQVRRTVWCGVCVCVGWGVVVWGYRGWGGVGWCEWMWCVVSGCSSVFGLQLWALRGSPLECVCVCVCVRVCVCVCLE